MKPEKGGCFAESPMLTPYLALVQTLRSSRRSTWGLPSVATTRREWRSAAKATAGLPPVPTSMTCLSASISSLTCGVAYQDIQLSSPSGCGLQISQTPLYLQKSINLTLPANLQLNSHVAQQNVHTVLFRLQGAGEWLVLERRWGLASK